MKIINKVAQRTLQLVMASSSLVLFVVTFLQVVFRFVFKAPLAWSQDVIRLCFTYLVFSGAAYCVQEHAHLNIDVFITLLPDKARKLLELLIQAALIGFAAFLIWFGCQFAQSGATQMAPYLPVPMSIYYMSVPISAVFMLFYMIQQFIEQIVGFKEPVMKGGEQA
ncbi:MAG TPA: TRAP transporter small permease [Clostridia bacterium]|nr:TRAP transporter small permease [Clostridia bacterium]